MADFHPMVTTNAGDRLLTGVLAGETQLLFTRIETAGTQIADTVNLKALTALPGARQSATISNVDTVENRSVSASAVFLNTGLTQDYEVWAYGLYAQNPDGGEVLLAISRSVGPADLMPADTGTAATLIPQMVLEISDTEHVSLRVDPEALALKKDLEHMVDLVSAQTVTGVKTFAAAPQADYTPTANGDMVNKAYVDNSTEALTKMDPVVIGLNAVGRESGVVAIGHSASSGYTQGTAVGGRSRANSYSTAFGYNSYGFGAYSTALGYNTYASGNGISIGCNACSSGGVALGVGAYSGRGVAVGAGAKANHGNSISIGTHSLADGFTSIAIGLDAAANQSGIALGNNAMAVKGSDLAMGENAFCSGSSSIAIGTNAVANDMTAYAIGFNALANGYNSIAIGSSTNATAYGTIAIGIDTVAEGTSSMAIGQRSYANSTGMAMGYDATANGRHAVSVGFNSVAGSSSVSFGVNTTSTTSAIAIGMNTTARNSGAIALGINAYVNGNASVAIGTGANANGMYAIALGFNTTSTGSGIAIGRNCNAINSISVVLGFASTASGTNNIVLGSNANGSNRDSIALGTNANCSGNNSSAIGGSSSAAGSCSIAMGCRAKADAYSSVALGDSSAAIGNWSIAVGTSAKAAQDSIALGHAANAMGDYSAALGYSTNAGGDHSIALGYMSNISEAESHIMQLGSSSLSTLRSRVELTVTSDERDKADITPISKGLDFVDKLQPVQFVDNNREKYLPADEDRTEEQQALLNKYGMARCYDEEAWRKGEKKGARKRVGVLAQQVRQALEEVYGTADYANLINDNLFDERAKGDLPEGVESRLTAAYANFVPFLIQAVQELHAQVKELQQ